MSNQFVSARNCIVFGSLVMALSALLQSAQAATLHTLYSFVAGSDGDAPLAGMVSDSAGNLYGTTAAGGNTGCGGVGCGVVFKISPAQGESVLYTFKGKADGGDVQAGVILDGAGNLFGTTYLGGRHNLGTVFEITPDGAESVLHSFSGGLDGESPSAGLIIDISGNLYGTTYYGGAAGLGTIFKVAADGTETVLHSFAGGGENDGADPYSSLIADTEGNLYGTTYYGGLNEQGCVYKLATNGQLTLLYSFANGTDGASPVSNLVMDKRGRLYGTTVAGGQYGYGTVFKIASDGTETILHSFAGQPNDGLQPFAGLLRDGSGNFYGTTAYGGTDDVGVIFKLASDGTETVLHSFSYGDGAQPRAPLLRMNKHYYGTTGSGGDGNCQGFGCGTVFKLRP
jgi:uncharacterized repeat protein (TIGR03803 family)